MENNQRFWTKSYDKHVMIDLPYPQEALGTILDKSMARFPDSPACSFMETTFSFTELRNLVHQMATYLQKHGMEKGDVMALCLPNCPQYIIATISTLLVGGVCSGCSPLLSADEMLYQLNDSRAKFLITLDAVYANRLYARMKDLPHLTHIIYFNISDLMGLSTLTLMLGKLLKKIPSGTVLPYPGKEVTHFSNSVQTHIDFMPADINIEEDLAFIQYTGGTTGCSKGVMLTHRNLMANLLQVRTWLNVQVGEEVVVSAFPYFHTAGLMVLLMTMTISSTLVVIPNPRDTDHIIKELIRKKGTIVANVPTLYMMLLNNPKSATIPRETLDRLKGYISGAAPFPVETIKNFQRLFRAENKMIEAYGMTESSPLLTANPYLGKKKLGTVGLPLPSTDIRIVDLETNKPAEIGKPGEICARGPQVFKGYLHKPAETAATVRDGWLHTGDVGIMDEEGYIRLVDRTKDMLIVSGFKVFSVHVEDILTKHPMIEMVAIIGKTDPNRPGSEIVKAVAQLVKGISPTDDVKADIEKYAAEHLSTYERPRIWEFRDELPLTPVGKVLKRALKDVDGKSAD